MDDGARIPTHRLKTFALVFAAISILAAGLCLGQERPLHFKVDSDKAAVALNEFSRQSDLQVLYDYLIVKELTTKRVYGEFDPSQALERLLDGTSLAFDFVNERTIAITLASSFDVPAGDAAKTLPRLAAQSHLQVH
jgi:hypothetical protein